MHFINFAVINMVLISSFPPFLKKYYYFLIFSNQPLDIGMKDVIHITPFFPPNILWLQTCCGEQNVAAQAEGCNASYSVLLQCNTGWCSIRYLHAVIAAKVFPPQSSNLPSQPPLHAGTVQVMWAFPMDSSLLQPAESGPEKRSGPWLEKQP